MMSEGQLGTEKEAVARRILAFVIDSMIILVLFALWYGVGYAFIYIFKPEHFPPQLLLLPILTPPFSFSLLANPLTIWVIYAFVLEGWKGRTIGKKALNLIVVGEDGNPCGFKRSFIRNVLRFIDGLGYYILGLIVMLLSERMQRIGDHLARTFVVKVM